VRRAAALALVACALGPAAASADADPGLAFDLDGRQVLIAADQLATAPVSGPTTYVVDGVPQTLTGTTVRDAITLTGASPDAIDAVTASAGVALLQLTRPDVAAVPARFPEGPPLVWVDGDGRTTLLRPATATGQSAQVIRSDPGQPLEVSIAGAQPLEVAIIASVGHAKVGERVPLMARSGSDDATYAWDFGDGTVGDGSDVRHAFTAPGRYRVTVTVSDGAGGGGTSQPFVVIVEDEAAQTEPKAKPEKRQPATAATAAAAPVTPAPAPAAAPPAVAPAAAAATPKRAAQAKPKQQPRPKAETPDPDAISGTLLADVSSPQSIAVQQAVVAAAPTDGGSGFHVPAIVWIGLGAIAAVSLGAAAERRRR
jgi:hypothetical protein